jgi:hypothetical protein
MAPAKKIYTCTTCGKVGFWDKNWSYYGSLAHCDACPDDLIFCCSDYCRKIATKNIESGQWKLSHIGKYGVIRSDRKGY